MTQGERNALFLQHVVKYDRPRLVPRACATEKDANWGSFILYLVVGFIVVFLMGMSMTDPMTWVSMLAWPLVAAFQMLLLLIQVMLYVLEFAYAAVLLGIMVLGGILLLACILDCTVAGCKLVASRRRW